MTFAGVALIIAGLLTAISPVAFVAGVLLLWSGLIKIVVLRIWRATLASPPIPPDIRAVPRTPPASRSSTS
jgi:sulfite exporter TauE/SafE